MSDATAAEQCEHAGHEWTPAGGGLLICLRCEAETWDDDARRRAAQMRAGGQVLGR